MNNQINVLNRISNGVWVAASSVREFFSKTSEIVISNMALSIVASVPPLSVLPPVNTVFSDRFLKLSHEILAKPVIYARYFLTSILPSNIEDTFKVTFNDAGEPAINYRSSFLSDASEEIAYRGIIHSLILKEAPVFILKKIAPKYQNLVDHKIAKISRITLTSLLFALAHVDKKGSYQGFLVSQFLGGLYYSYMRENGSSIAELAFAHFSFNAILRNIRQCNIESVNSKF